MSDEINRGLRAMSEESELLMNRLRAQGILRIGVKMTPAPETHEQELRRLLLFAYEHLRHPMLAGEMQQSQEFKRIKEILS